jgi:hypothetical protein
MPTGDIALDIVNYINNSEFDEVLPYFGDFETALNFLKKKGYLHLLDPFEVPDEFRNGLIHFLLSEKETREGTLKTLISRLSDVKEENGQYYLILDGREELAELFEEYNRDISPYDIAKLVLGENFWEPFYNLGENVYRDVVEELNPDNKNYLKSYILDELKDTKIELDGQSSEEMELIASEQGHDDHMIVNQENIDRILGDEETMDWLFKNDLDGLHSDLGNIYTNAYNSAFTDEVYNKVWDEILTYIDDKVVNDFKWGKGYRQKVKITNHINSVIDDWFSEYKNYSDDFDYYGSYLGIIKQLTDDVGRYEKLSFRIPDYADSSDVENNVNQMLRDYI